MDELVSDAFLNKYIIFWLWVMSLSAYLQTTCVKYLQLPEAALGPLE